jgi:hypothetical protein
MIPLGRFSILIGRPGTTKTLALIDICAQMNRGVVRGDLEGIRSNVLYVTRENPREESLAPRAKAAGVVQSRFFHYKEEFTLPEDTMALRALIVAKKARLIVLDTLSDYTPVSLNNQGAAVKSLQPLADMADELDVAIVGVMWASKHAKGLAAVPGSIGNSGTVRCVLVVGQIAPGEYVIGTYKVNDGPEKFGFVYRFEVVEPDPENFPGVEAPQIDWDHARRAKP